MDCIMGYYGGKGGRLMRSMGPLQGVTQPDPVVDGNLLECRWSKSVSLQIPDDWISGVYLGKLSSLETDGEAYIVFIVRDERKADLMFQSSDMTWSRVRYEEGRPRRAARRVGISWSAVGRPSGPGGSFQRPRIWLNVFLTLYSEPYSVVTLRAGKGIESLRGIVPALVQSSDEDVR